MQHHKESRLMISYIEQSSLFRCKHESPSKNRHMRNRIPFLSFLFILSVSVSALSQELPKNIIFFIGDGLGLSQGSALHIKQGKTNFGRFPVIGLSDTRSAVDLVTESAAAATALSTGELTKNGAVAVDVNGKDLKTLAEYARSLGKSVGIIATSSITHATPAAFVAHVESRQMHDEIARQIADGNFDVLIGGGKQYFLPKERGGVRTDGKNLIDEMRQKKYFVGFNHDESLKNARKLLLLLADDGLPKATERQYSLTDLFRKAFSILKRNPAGYLLVIEGSQIDWAGHDNDFEYLLGELKEFDAVIGHGLNLAEEHPETLVLVTGDHETGGLTLYGSKTDGSDLTAKWSSGDHTAAMVPVFAFGPGAENFRGIYSIGQVGKTLFKLLRRKK